MKDTEIIHMLLEHFKFKYKFKFETKKDLFDLEINLLIYLIELGKEMMNIFFKEIGNGYISRVIKIKNNIFKSKGDLPRSIHALFGKVYFKRAYYRGNKNGYAPLDIKLGINKGHTPACQYFLGSFTGNDAYEQGVKRFNEIFRPAGVESISLKKAIKMSNELGTNLEQLRQNEIEDVMNYKNIKKNNEINNMIVSVDATKIREILGIEKIDKNGKKKLNVDYKDAKIAAISEIHWDERQNEAKSINSTYVAAEEHANIFFKRIYAEVNKRATDIREQLIVIIGDGAKWIWDRAKDITQNRLEILDFFHAMKHLSDILKKLFGEETEEYKKRYLNWYDKTYAGKIYNIIKELKKIAQGKTGEINKMLIKEINYFESHIDRMKYNVYREMNLPIGSGTIESACKNVIGGRLKGTGMKWSELGADSMLQIRSSIKSDRLRDDFEETFLLEAA